MFPCLLIPLSNLLVHSSSRLFVSVFFSVWCDEINHSKSSRERERERETNRERERERGGGEGGRERERYDEFQQKETTPGKVTCYELRKGDPPCIVPTTGSCSWE